MWRYGGEGLRIGRFTLVFLLFMIPLPTEIVGSWAPALQRFIAAFSAVFLEALTVPVEQQGIFLLLPGMTLEVAEECSGLRFLLILFVLVSAFARLVLATRRSQMLLVVLAVPVAVFANVSRVAVTSASAYAIGPEAITGPLHYYIGKSFWGIAMIGMIALALVLRAQSMGVATATSSRTKELIADAP